MTERFDDLPLLGKAEVTYEESERPMGLDYHLIKSGTFKVFYGTYKLIPTPDGKRTLLELVNHTDTGMHAPFCGILTKNTSKKHSTQRLLEIKRLAETTSEI